MKLLELQNLFKKKLERNLSNSEIAFLKWMYQQQKTEVKLKK